MNKKDTQIKELKKKVKKLEREINCVKNHPKLKSLNCCYHADSFELQTIREIIWS